MDCAFSAGFQPGRSDPAELGRPWEDDIAPHVGQAAAFAIEDRVPQTQGKELAKIDNLYFVAAK